MNWKTILVPHDFSSSANHAAAIARDEAKVHGGKIVLLHVIDLPTQFSPNTAVVPNETGAPISIKDYAIASAEAHLRDLSDRIEKDGVAVMPYIRLGHPVEQILSFAAEMKVDLIVMGTHGHSGIRHLIAGSVAERVVRSAVAPVLTVRHPDKAD